MATLAPGEKRPIKVARIIARLNVGGPALHCLTLSEGLAARGFETTLITGQIEAGEQDFPKLFNRSLKGFQFLQLPLLKRTPSFVGDLVSFVNLTKALRRYQPDIVHTHTAKAGLLGRLAAYLCGVPVVIHTFHGHVLSGYFGKVMSNAVRIIEKMIAYKTTVLVTLSEGLKNELSGKFRVAPLTKFKVVPLGRDLKPFWEMPRGKGAFRAELGLSPEVFLMGAIGRLVPIKNFGLCLEALAQSSHLPDWHFVLVGDGPERENLKSLAEKLGIAPRVSFLGWRSDLAEIYSDLDVSILSSLNEGTPLSIIEAFAAGCPVIATDVGGVGDLFSEDGEEGLLVPSEDVSALEAAIGWMGTHRSEREEMSEHARKRSKRYSDSALLDNIENLYRGLLRQQGVCPA